LNPIEELFSSFKSYLKRYGETLVKNGFSDYDIVDLGFESITPEKCQAWIAHAGYKNVQM